ncbi:MAG: hypothetical protein ABII94_03175 [Patescibacteria group bacterium]
MISIIFLIIFLCGLGFFGWQVSRRVLKINNIELLIPLSLAISYGAYIFLLNVSSYLIPIELNFYLVFVVLLIVAFVLFFSNKQRLALKFDLSKKEGLIIFLVVFIIMIFSGLIVSRYIESDNLAYTHLPTAASIVGGNFPIKNLNLPNYDSVYHYGSNLFYAAVSRITGFSVVSVFNFSVFLFSGIIFLLIFNIAKLFIKNNFGSFLVALVGMFGGGFRFIYGFDGLIILFKRFILHYNIDHPFKFFGQMWSVDPITGPLAGNIFYNWGVLGWMLSLVIIYLYLRIIRSNKWSYYYDFLIIILLSVLVLHFEMAFISICFGILVVPFIFYVKKRNKEDFKNLLKHSLLILFITATIVLFQGGTITMILKNILQDRVSYGMDIDFSVFKNLFSFDIGNGTVFPFYNSIFILNFGLIYFLIIPAIVFVIRKHFKKGIFLVSISCFSFLVPLIVSFNWFWQGTLNRFFRFSSAICAILVGLSLIIILLQLKNRDFLKKTIIFVCLIVICLDGVLFLTTRPLYKREEYRIDNNKFFATLRPPLWFEAKAYEWVKINSNIKDYFLVFADRNDINNQATIFENFRFVIFTQRMAPVYTMSHNHINPTLPQDEYYTPHYKKLISNCENKEMTYLNYKYLFVNKDWPEGLEEKCLANNNLELKFEIIEIDKFVRIYKVNYIE